VPPSHSFPRDGFSFLFAPSFYSFAFLLFSDEGGATLIFFFFFFFPLPSQEFFFFSLFFPVALPARGAILPSVFCLKQKGSFFRWKAKRSPFRSTKRCPFMFSLTSHSPCVEHFSFFLLFSRGAARSFVKTPPFLSFLFYFRGEGLPLLTSVFPFWTPAARRRWSAPPSSFFFFPPSVLFFPLDSWKPAKGRFSPFFSRGGGCYTPSLFFFMTSPPFFTDSQFRRARSFPSSSVFAPVS